MIDSAFFIFLYLDIPGQAGFHNITTIIDLREVGEQVKKPCVLQNDKAFKYITLSVTGGNAVPKSTDEVASSYIKMADSVMDEIVEAIMNAETNVMYFCNAGKDRTGVATAIILSKLGYDREYIIADYLKSGENLKDELYAYAKSNPDIDIKVITPHREYIEDFLDWYKE